jgi:hypothetical protein
MKKLTTAIIALVFMLGCAAFPPPVAAQSQKGTPAAAQKFKIGDRVIINSGQQKVEGVIVDIITIHSKANNKDTISYTAEIKNVFNFNEGDPRVTKK